MHPFAAGLLAENSIWMDYTLSRLCFNPVEITSVCYSLRPKNLRYLCGDCFSRYLAFVSFFANKGLPNFRQRRAKLFRAEVEFPR